MSIESLNKAASAAGFAMATPDDDLVADPQSIEKAAAPESRAVVVQQWTTHLAGSDTLGRVTDWVKAYLPGVGWRAPA